MGRQFEKDVRSICVIKRDSENFWFMRKGSSATDIRLKSKNVAYIL